MNSIAYSIEIDCLSGQPNPVINIPAHEFDEIFNRIIHLNNSEPRPLFDGLGFRGFRIKAKNREIIIQKEIIRIKEDGRVDYKRSSAEILRFVHNVIIRNNKDEKITLILRAIQTDYN